MPWSRAAPDGRRRRSCAQPGSASSRRPPGRFVEHGYQATTIEAIADDAGVAVQTVYYDFGTKRDAAGRPCSTPAIAGDADPSPCWTVLVDELAERARPRRRRRPAGRAPRWRSSPARRRSTTCVRHAAGRARRRRPARRPTGPPGGRDQRRLVELLAEAGHLRPASTSTPPPTSSTPWSTRRSSCCSSATAAGTSTASAAGSPTPCATNCWRRTCRIGELFNGRQDPCRHREQFADPATPRA